MMVFIVHALPRSWFPGGLGVDIFFVISGYLITSILLKEYRQKGRIDLAGFYIKRLLRLYPALILMILVCVPVYYLLNGGVKVAMLSFATAITYTANVVMTLFDMPGIGAISHTWSLAMEEQYYMVWPLLFGLSYGRLSRVGMVVFLTVMTMASLAGWYLFGKSTPFNPLLKLGGLAVGSLFAIETERLEKISRFMVGPGLLAISMAILGETFGVLQRNVTLPIVTIASPFVVLYLAKQKSGVIAKVFANDHLAFVGVLSYSFYLWHYPVLFIMKRADLPGWIHFTGGLVMTSIMTLASYYWLELPIQRHRPAMVTKIKEILRRNRVLGDTESDVEAAG